MKIAYKFALGFGSVLVLLLVVSLTSLAGIHSLHQKVFRITQINNKEKQAALDLRASVTDITIAVRNVLLFESPSDKKVEEMTTSPRY